jgi:hypothetical protein
MRDQTPFSFCLSELLLDHDDAAVRAVLSRLSSEPGLSTTASPEASSEWVSLSTIKRHSA